MSWVGWSIIAVLSTGCWLWASRMAYGCWPWEFDKTWYATAGKVNELEELKGELEDLKGLIER